MGIVVKLLSAGLRSRSLGRKLGLMVSTLRLLLGVGQEVEMIGDRGGLLGGLRVRMRLLGKLCLEYSVIGTQPLSKHGLSTLLKDKIE